MDTKHGVGATFKQPQGPGPPPDSRFKVSSTAPVAGQKVVFDATELGGHDYRWDLNGDGLFERRTLAQPSVAVVYGQPGTYGVSVQVDGGHGALPAGRRRRRGSAGVRRLLPRHLPAARPRRRSGVPARRVVRGRRRRGPLPPPPRRGYVTDAPVRVNGIDLLPTNGALIVFDPAALTIANEGGLVTMQVAETQFSVGPLSWSGLGGSDGRATVFNQDARDVPGSAFEDFEVTGRIHLDLVAGGSSEFGTDMELPDILGDVDRASPAPRGQRGRPPARRAAHPPADRLDQRQDPDPEPRPRLRRLRGQLGRRALDPAARPSTTSSAASFGMVHGQFDHAVGRAREHRHAHRGRRLPPGASGRASGRRRSGSAAGSRSATAPQDPRRRPDQADGDFTIVFSDPAVFNFTGMLTVLSLVEIGDAYTTYSTDGNLHFGGELHRTWAPGVSIGPA